MALALALFVASAAVAAAPNADDATPTVAAARAPTHTVELDALRPLPFALITPAGTTATMRPDELVARLGALYERWTDLRPAPLTAEPLARCRGRLTCLVEVARAALEPTSPWFLLVVSVIPTEGADLVSIAFVDLALATAEIDGLRATSGAFDAAEAERRILDRALVGPEERREVRGAAELEAFVDALMSTHHRAALERAGHFEPHGAIAVEGGPATGMITLDGKGLAPSPGPGGSLLVVRVPPGSHTLTLRFGALDAFARTLTIARGQTERINLADVAAPHEARRYEAALRWGGVAAAGLGAALVVHAAASPTTAVTCWGDTPCDAGFARFGSPDTPGLFDDPAGTGAPIAPLGLGLAALGLGTVVANELFAEDTWPGWPLVVGLAAGLATFTVTSALDAPTSVGAR